MTGKKQKLIYKIIPETIWRESDELFQGSAVDHADGFIHFSAAHQVAETAARHFSGQSGLLLVAVEEAALGEALKWEVSRGGALFPHLYGALPLSAVRSVQAIITGPDGIPRIPPLA